MNNQEISESMSISLGQDLPNYPKINEEYRRAPKREAQLSENDVKLALKNALRYIPEQHHEQMSKEFYEELQEHGRIYGYRYRPEGSLSGKSIDMYKAIW